MVFEESRYRDSLCSYDKWSRPLDDSLYSLCRQHPGHQDYAGVAAKCWIIGRTYATGIERKIPSGGTQGSSLAQLVHQLVRNGQRMDDLIAPLHELEGPLSTHALEVILSAHGQFLALLAGVVRSNQTPRSFASKYLHFHCPLVPIYDSIVVNTIPGLVRWNKSLLVFSQPETADDEYAWFCYRFWKLYTEAEAAVGRDVTVKLLDNHLLCLAEGPQ